MGSYKIVGRHATTKLQNKKRIYVSWDDFRKYAPELLYRYVNNTGWIAEAYQLVDKKWVLLFRSIPYEKVNIKYL